MISLRDHLRASVIPWFLFLFSCSSDPTLPRYEFVPDMVDAVPFEAFSKNPVTRDGKTLLTPALGTIPRGFKPLHYGTGKEEAERAGRELSNPIARTPEALARGEKVYSVFCAVCHGMRGLGDGPVVPRFPGPPSLLAANAKSMPDGKMFHVLSRGQGLMPPYAAQVSADDRWRAVHFVRALQVSAGRQDEPPRPKERQGRNIMSSGFGALGVLAVGSADAGAEADGGASTGTSTGTSTTTTTNGRGADGGAK
ncbi:MAG: cytochrome c [Deltaproteobacteria bacterium]|nr:cytochrome c [Deltaproteobacteria bacterium]